MKKKINLIVVSAIFLAGGCATIHKIDSTKLEVIKASEIIRIASIRIFIPLLPMGYPSVSM